MDSNNSNIGHFADIFGECMSTAAAKNQLLNNQDEDGCHRVNQETIWDIPATPEHGCMSTATAKNQLLNNQDEWGCHRVNQDTIWDVPATPEHGCMSTAAAKNQLLNSQDEWGCHRVNQDTIWDVPATPEHDMILSDVDTVWKLNSGNGTKFWKANLRNGSPPPFILDQMHPWARLKSLHLGGNPFAEQSGQPSTSTWLEAQSAAVGLKKNGDCTKNEAAGSYGNVAITE